MTDIAVIPCRGGSKGIPRKNLQTVHGIPLVVRTIFACFEAGISDVYVSTDNEEIRSYSEAAGAQIIDRPAELAQDFSSTDSVLSHAVQSLLLQGFKGEDNLLLLQATSPFTKSETIQDICKLLKQQPNAGVFTATEWHGFIWDLNNGVVSPYKHDHKNRRRRQDLSPQVLETGGVYGGTIDNFSSFGVRFIEPLIPVIVDRIEAIEIDTLDDLNFCNAISVVKRSRDLSNVRVVFTDFDGVLTDNRVLQSESEEFGSFVNRSDGVAISYLKSKDIPVIIITGEKNGAAFGRASKLGIPCVYSEDKLKSIVDYCTNHDLTFSEVAYIGNDLNDLDSLATCGWTFTPIDAHPAALKCANKILHTKGGYGVFREMINSLSL